MRKITEVLRLKFAAKLSHAQIAGAVGLSKGAVGKVVSLAQANGLSWPLPEGMDEAALEGLLYRLRVGGRRYTEPDHAQLHTELKRKGVTLQQLWSEYAADAGEQAYRYTHLRTHYRRAVERRGVPSADLRRRAGGLQLHLRRGHQEPIAAGLDRLASAGAGILRRGPAVAGAG